MRIQDEIDEFHKKIRARALLIAIEWAGSAEALGKMIGLERSASRKWVKCGQIPPLCALALSRIRGFPLGFGEMCPADDMRTLKRRLRFQCPHCMKDINPPRTRTESSLLLMGCSEATARKRAAASPKQSARAARARAAKRKQLAQTTNPPPFLTADSE